MGKLLEKIIKDAIEDGKYSFGTKEAISTIKNSKVLVLSNSISEKTLEKIQEVAKNSKVLSLNYDRSSVELGRLCGTQFRISVLSLKTLSESNLKALAKELEIETK